MHPPLLPIKFLQKLMVNLIIVGVFQQLALLLLIRDVLKCHAVVQATVDAFDGVVCLRNTRAVTKAPAEQSLPYPPPLYNFFITYHGEQRVSVRSFGLQMLEVSCRHSDGDVIPDVTDKIALHAPLLQVEASPSELASVRTAAHLPTLNLFHTEP